MVMRICSMQLDCLSSGVLADMLAEIGRPRSDGPQRARAWPALSDRQQSTDCCVDEDELSFEQLVERYYQPLYRFALGLSGRENDAWDLTQQTFYRWATKRHQLLDPSKAKSWLFTTLHREFLNSLRRQSRFPHLDIQTTQMELPPVPPAAEARTDGDIILEALARVEEPFRSPLVLFYLEDHSYKEIAEILGVPPGTVMSRISRGKALLRQLLADRPPLAGGGSPGTPLEAKPDGKF